jgi:ClpP class serine protease
VGLALPTHSPRRAVDLSPRALLAAGVSGVLAADLLAAEGGRWSLATRAEDIGPTSIQLHKVGDRAAVAVVSVMGPIDQRATWQPCEGMTDGYDTIEARFSSAVNAVKQAGGGKVVMVIDSPGGDAAGMVPSVRRMIALRDRAGVQVETVAEERATSAAYALSLVGNRFHVPRGGRTASIGTVIVRKQAEGAEGVEVFRSGDRKMRPNAVEPLNKDDRDDLQAIVDESASEFASLVAEVRGKTSDHWLSLKGASLSGEAAVKAGLADTNMNAHEVIEMALKDAEQAEIAEAAGLTASASFVEIKAKMVEMRGAAGELTAAREAQAKAEREKMALEESIARQARETEAMAKRAAFVSEVKAACSSGLITPPREASLIAYYDKHGEAAARDTFAEVKSNTPIVRGEKVGAAPETSSAVESDPMSRMTAEDHAHCERRGFDKRTYAERKYGMASEVK